MQWWQAVTAVVRTTVACDGMTAVSEVTGKHAEVRPFTFDCVSAAWMMATVRVTAQPAVFKSGWSDCACCLEYSNTQSDCQPCCRSQSKIQCPCAAG